MIDQKFKRKKKLQKAIKLNLKRRTVIVDDQLVYHEGVPTPSWIELSIIDVCNRSCSFCPKADPKIAPNTYQKMTMSLVEKLTNDLKKINYQGSVTLCGYGEPMLHKGVFEMSKKLAEAAFVEIVTNGDTLKSDTINKLYNSNVNKLLISLYDGPDQVTKFKKMAKEAKVPEDFVILRDRWHGSDKDYGLKLTNRTGTIDIGNQDSIGTFTYCNYPSYSVLIDWNGDVFLCPQDWQRKMTTGNIEKEDFFEIWTGSTISKFRKNLLEGNRCDKPCTECNAEGTVLGKNHASAWKKIYKKNI